ncbi:MAG TPA: type II toxin-antitoxin system RelE/ParE family toxin [Candidatus Kapabacteria bacterium]|nr:type II toxin-antitoxin system RelE/ParE family toxin [Candidatus Kapabacteria bacterium]
MISLNGNVTFKIKAFISQNGRRYFREWFKELDYVTQAIVAKRLLRVERANLGDVKNLGDGVHEMRIHYLKGYRIYFGYDGTDLIILLTGSDKDNQARTIAKAKEYWKEYETYRQAD